VALCAEPKDLIPKWPILLVSLFSLTDTYMNSQIPPHQEWNVLPYTYRMSLDRVFVHALNTVKKIPRTGSARPPPADRLRLYGLYKQAMEGDVDGVMERPGGSGLDKDDDEDTIREQEKWDAWDSQKGVSRTEAKRRYIEALIETMHKYASTTA
jgi:acyl-CoA-binding protein